ncbi:MAG: hypothetical protein Q9218_005359 [Villophora microphyllina]
MLISLTVGKVDAGVAVLLTEDKRLIEFPSILLPPSISSGSIVDITVSRNFASEAAAQKSFQTLQSSILDIYGQHTPSPPILRCRNATQTSIVLEWDPISLATAELRSLSLYRNGSKAGNIPKPMEMTTTKMSGLAVDTEYEFQLILRTSAGVYSSEKLVVRTHKMTDLSGITITPGIMPPPLRESLGAAVDRIGAKIAETVRIDTTHFVCMEGRGREWEKALEMNIPVVRPEWVEGCEREGRIAGVRGYYLNADPKLRQVGQGVGLGSPQRQQSQQQQRTYTRIDGSEATGIPSGQLPTRGGPDAASSPSAHNLRASNQPPPPMSPSEVGSPAPPPPEKDTPREFPLSQVSPSQSGPSVPASPDEESAPSQATSTERVDEQPQQQLKPSQENGGISKKPGDNASMDCTMRTRAAGKTSKTPHRQENQVSSSNASDRKHGSDLTNSQTRTLQIRRPKAPARPIKTRANSNGLSFLSLPPEVRVKIYLEAFTFERILVRRAKARRAAGLLLTNRLIYLEAFPIFYEANVFQVPIHGSPDDHAAIANVHYMRQCCLDLEIDKVPDWKFDPEPLITKFVDKVRDGRMECLLIEAWEYGGYYFATRYLEDFLQLRQIHLAQVVVQKKTSKYPEWRRYQDKWCQELERSMMARDPSPVEFGDDYEAFPKIGIDLVGDELESSKRSGGWVIGDNDLYALFGLC